jgi:hypothetical protein
VEKLQTAPELPGYVVVNGIFNDPKNVRIGNDSFITLNR